jgi:hypothetical protein
MIRIVLSYLLILLSYTIQAQTLDFGIMVGGSNYQGDLQEKYYEFKQMHLSFGGSLTYNFNKNWSLRGEVLKGNLSGADATSDRDFALGRNLAFHSQLYEINMVGIYRFSKLKLGGITPYIFGGLAGFRINPYTYDTTGRKFYLFLLSTEGQGLPQYPDVASHRLLNISVPIGGGITWALTSTWSLGLEMGFRKTFTDYVDDVSGFYADKNFLLQERGPDAVEMAYRGDETSSGNPQYPAAGSPRGNPKAKDWYYNTIVRLQFKGFGKSLEKKKNLHQMECPNVW